MPATVVSIINLKGGVGKSTLTMILGEFLAFRYSKRVLLIDMDAQANLSYCMMHPSQVRIQEQRGRTSYHIFSNALRGIYTDVGDFIADPPLTVSNISRSSASTYGTPIHMIVSTPAVSQLDEELLEIWERGQPMPTGIRETLSLYLEEAKDRYDYILIDCPPGLSLFSSAALLASDFYVSPVIPEPLSLQGVDLVQARANALRDRHNTDIKFAGTIMNIVKHYRNTHSRVSEIIHISDSSRYQPFRFWLPDNERLRTLGDYEPKLSASGQWAMDMERKFRSLFDKYDVSHRLTNPPSGVLDRSDDEGKRYRLRDRLTNLVEEFQERCK